MTQTALDQYALANGFGKTTAKMSEAEKVALRYSFVQKQLATASGDFARTSDSWANQTRLLSLQFNSLKASIGQGLINAFLPVIKVMNTLLAKIQTVASAFSSLTAKVFGKADTSAQAVASSVEGIGDATTEAVGGVGKAADAAGKAAKKAASSATSIDELNIVGSDSDSQGGGATGAGSLDGAIAGLGDIKSKTEENIETPMSKALENIKKIVGEIKKQFESGFMERFAKIDFSPIKSSIEGIKESLKTLFSDSDMAEAASRFISTFAYSVGANLANFVSIGTNIISMILGGINTSLAENIPYLNDRFTSIFDSGTKYLEINTQVIDFLADLVETITGENGKSITSSLVSIFATSVSGIKDLLVKFGVDFYDLVTSPILNNKDKILKAVDGTLKPISEIAKKISDFVKESWEKVFETYEKYIEPAFENFKSGLDKIVSKILDVYNTYFVPVLEGLSEKFGTFVDEHLTPLRDAFLETFGKLIEGISQLWDEVLAPFIAWLIEKLGPVVAEIFEGAGTVLFTFLGVASEVIETVLKVFGDLIDFIKNVFQGKWKEAWNAIKKIFSDIWDGIKGIVKTIWDAIYDLIGKKIVAVWDKITEVMGNIKDGIKGALDTISENFSKIFNGIKDTVSGIFEGLWKNIKSIINTILGGIEGFANGVIRGINKVINALNTLQIDVPDWVTDLTGIKAFGFNIPTLNEVKIPKLAKGGFVKANTPQLAMIGDNRHQGEVVAPEDKLLEMALKAAKLASQDNQNYQTAELLTAIVELLKQMLNALFGLNLSAEVDGRTLLTILTNEQNRSGLELIT